MTYGYGDTDYREPGYRNPEQHGSKPKNLNNIARLQSNLAVPLGGVSHRLSDLVKGTQIQFDPAFSDRFVSGITQMAQDAGPGDIFAAFPGRVHHGIDFIDQVRDCAGILTDQFGAQVTASKNLDNLPVLITHSAKNDFMTLLEKIYPIDGIRIFGVTGTNGKTSTLHIAAKILELLGLSFGISTTIHSSPEAQNGGSCLTTPEICQLYARISAAKQAGAALFALEVSSHAISRERLGNVLFEVAGFTNLTPEHMEEHGNMEDYYKAKKGLFLRAKRGVISVDTEYGMRLARETTCATAVISRHPISRFKALLDPEMFWHVTTRSRGSRSEFTLIAPDGFCLDGSISLPGESFALNACMAIVILCNLGIEPERINAVLKGGLNLVLPGRMEVFQNCNRPRVIVDHGHTIDAVKTALVTARSMTDGRVITIINADGDRDPAKRKHLGRICGNLSDRLFITDGHYRFEDPAEIRRMILDGVESRKHEVEQIPSMTEAVLRAIEIAGPNDIVLCSGFGDDPYFDIRGQKIPYSLRDEVRKALEIV